MTDAYQEARKILERLDALWDAGLGDSDEADLLRERGSDLWYAMTAAERDALQGDAPAANPV